MRYRTVMLAALVRNRSLWSYGRLNYHRESKPLRCIYVIYFSASWIGVCKTTAYIVNWLQIVVIEVIVLIMFYNFLWNMYSAVYSACCSGCKKCVDLIVCLSFDPQCNRCFFAWHVRPAYVSTSYILSYLLRM